MRGSMRRLRAIEVLLKAAAAYAPPTPPAPRVGENEPNAKDVFSVQTGAPVNNPQRKSTPRRNQGPNTPGGS
ncbi:MAG: hypothetical protein ACFCD0_14065 [Gemmataceae bacterium]